MQDQSLISDIQLFTNTRITLSLLLTLQVAQRLRDEALSAVYSSDLARAVQSAHELAAAAGLQVAV